MATMSRTDAITRGVTHYDVNALGAFSVCTELGN